MKKILWAVDLLDESDFSSSHPAKFLKDWVNATDAMVFPVFILDDKHLSLIDQTRSNHPDTDLLSESEERFYEQVRALGLSNMEKVDILLQDPRPYSPVQSARTLIDYGERLGATLIVSSSHGRTGMNLLMEGSFAEALCLESSIPVIVIGPHTDVKARGFKKILFPTDLGPFSERTFEKALEMAVMFQSELILFHAHLLHRSFLNGGRFPSREVIKKEMDEREKVIQNFKHLAEEHQISLYSHSIILLNPSKDAISSAILQLSQTEEVDLIALETQSSRIGAAWHGSISRAVSRESKIPTCIFRSDMHEKAKTYRWTG